MGADESNKNKDSNSFNITISQNNIEKKYSPLQSLFNLTPTDKSIYTNPYLFLCYNFLINGCKIEYQKLDELGDCVAGWRINPKNGPPGHEKKFKAPNGWIAVGLKVINLYDNGNNDWLGRDNSPGEWYIAYHGTKTMDSVRGIVNEGFKRGDGQFYETSPNIHPLTKKKYPYCMKGVYLTPDIDEAKNYTIPIYFSGNIFRVVLMCRVNPFEVRIASKADNIEYWIVNGDSFNDVNAKKKDSEVRPYRILISIEKT